LKFVGDETDNYLRKIVWDTVHYRWEKFFFRIFQWNSR
jgi:trehalose-6-phosphate synthase